MSQQANVKPRTRTKTKVERPKLWRSILLNDDYTPREFVVMVLKAVFRMGEEAAYAVMLTAHRRGACVIAVFTKDVAETKGQGGDRPWAGPRLSARVLDRARGIAREEHEENA